MTVKEFFAQHGVTNVETYNTKPGSKIPYIMVAKTPKGELDCIPSTKGYDRTKPGYVYPVVVDDVDLTTGESKGKKDLYVFSNNAGKAPDATLSVTDFA